MASRDGCLSVSTMSLTGRAGRRHCKNAARHGTHTLDVGRGWARPWRASAACFASPCHIDTTNVNENKPIPPAPWSTARSDDHAAHTTVCSPNLCARTLTLLDYQRPRNSGVSVVSCSPRPDTAPDDKHMHCIGFCFEKHSCQHRPASAPPRVHEPVRHVAPHSYLPTLSPLLTLLTLQPTHTDPDRVTI
ncbi:hypothetical protein GGP41_005697 [Bipolaris sorokiniana]|uniref:Uncharacterized protein n=1 Tax=Cochliobolus sativus TaxID=45130 RepID=A0A8H5ZFI2_COCSA|nr:hypothetical protein GGP41_005697 [Bipolaris sorokiniana]